MTVTFGPMELARRVSLDSMGVLDTPSEERYDRITRLARLSFDMLLSTITLIDRDRAWVKSAAGTERSESPRDDSFCTHTVLADAAIVVSDVRLDARFATLPVVLGPLGIRFYAGFPVHDRHGTAIGTLCLYDTRPRTLDQAGLATMAELTSWVESELDAGVDPDPSGTVLLPAPPVAPEIPGFDTAAFSHATTGRASDYFDHRHHGNVHAFAVAAIVGRGAHVARSISAVRTVLQSGNPPLTPQRSYRPGTIGEILTGVNSLLLEDLSSTDTMMTGFFGCAEPRSGTIRYVDAGHGLSIVVRADGSAEHLRMTDLPLGVTDTWRSTERSVTLEPGDDLVCFSGGLISLMGGTLDAIPAIAQLIEDADDPHRIVDDVRRLVAAAPLPDDITVLAIRRTA